MKQLEDNYKFSYVGMYQVSHRDMQNNTDLEEDLQKWHAKELAAKPLLEDLLEVYWKRS